MKPNGDICRPILTKTKMVQYKSTRDIFVVRDARQEFDDVSGAYERYHGEGLAGAELP